MGVVEALGVLFVALKLLGVIDWSWWLVLLPIYGGVVVTLAFILGGGLYIFMGRR